jgi:hypothetical protein
MSESDRRSGCVGAWIGLGFRSKRPVSRRIRSRRDMGKKKKKKEREFL